MAQDHSTAELPLLLCSIGLPLAAALGCGGEDHHSFRDHDTISLAFHAHGECPDNDLDGIGDCVDSFYLFNGVGRINPLLHALDQPSASFDSNYWRGRGGLIFDSDSRRLPWLEIAQAGYISNPDRAAATIDSVVVHNCDDSFPRCVETFTTPSEGKGIHFVVSRNGEVLQMASLLKSVAHATYYNRRSIGIELEGWTGTISYTAAMLQTLAQVLSLVHDELPSIPMTHTNQTAEQRTGPTGRYIECLDVSGIVGHKQIQPIEEAADNRYLPCRAGVDFATAPVKMKQDPGGDFDSRWARILDTAMFLSATRAGAPRVTAFDYDGYPDGGLHPPAYPNFGYGLTATGGNGAVPAVVVPYCANYTYNGGGRDVRGYLRLRGGDKGLLKCGSLEFGAVEGAPEIVLTEAAVLTVPAGAAVAIDQVDDGVVSIGVTADSTAAVKYEVGHQTTFLSPGTDFVTEVPEAVNEPPVCGTAPPLDLWPPNHKLHDVEVTSRAVVSDPDGDHLTISVEHITQDEPVTGNAMEPDATGVGSPVARIRAERAGGGNGRVYHVTYRADDGAASCTGVVPVHVPHDRSALAVDDGQNFDSTIGTAEPHRNHSRSKSP